jgi:hypothetical protein
MGLVVAAAAVSLMVIPAPSAHSSLADPCHVGVALGIIVVLALLVTRTMGDRGVQIERPLLAAFLAGMPLVYVGSWLWYRPADGAGLAWLQAELAGVPLYFALAWLGLRRWPWLLAVGIAAHGLCWDAWHYGRTPFVPDWYAFACLLMDVTLALYVATRVARFAGEPGWRWNGHGDRDRPRAA